jgi:hypothetical protein
MLDDEILTLFLFLLLQEAKEAGEKNEDCFELFPGCDKSLLDVKRIYDSL